LSRSSNIISIWHLTHNVSCASAKASNRVELLILDDPGLATLTPEQGRDLLEIVDNRLLATDASRRLDTGRHSP
jgi:DNA replication protein DnaC